MFRSLLIANRGEIACRVIATAKAMGLRTIAVYSDADQSARHVAMADTAIRIGPAPARDSYLSMEAILNAAKASGAEAIHPGYGFLSENAAFAEACAAAGIIFVGPPPAAIRAMGLKDAAKELMAKAGVPVVPGYHGDQQDGAFLKQRAGEIGYPVLIKAVAGGGGKGMRRVDEPSQFDAALAGAKREAQASFGDDRVLIERYVARPRHIEIQVFADAAGNAVSLFERDCSLQRRHQKVIEEAPAPLMPDALRRAMGDAAVTAAKAIGYRGAGTVEFIVDSSKGLALDGFFFMEMNTRLQVEHPVTEMVTGLDLVEWQLRVAAGEALPIPANGLSITGHAFEARLYAEDPARGFLPSTGTLHRLRFPSASAHVRIDTGVREGDAVSVHYDPMIAKIIVWDRDRPAALRRLESALLATEVAGVKTNAAFLLECARHPSFRAGEVETGFIAAFGPALIPQPGPPPSTALAAACLAILCARETEAGARAAADGFPGDPWARLDGFRVGRAGHASIDFEDWGGEGPLSPVVTYEKGGRRILSLPDGEHELQGDWADDGTLSGVWAGRPLRAGVVRLGQALLVTLDAATYRFVLSDPLSVDILSTGALTAVRAPMPGKIIQVLVKPGDTVARGQALVVLEAMKMEHTLSAPGEAEIETVTASTGDQVQDGAVLVTFKT